MKPLLKQKMIQSGEDIDNAIDYLASTLKNKLTHETTAKMREILPLLDESSLKKAEEIFKKNKWLMKTQMIRMTFF